MIVSDRDIPLLCQKPAQGAIITCEDYAKWYSLFLLHPNGAVTPLEYFLLEDAADPMPAYVDHVPNPAAVARYANAHKLTVHERSFEVMVGRWVQEGLPFEAGNAIVPVYPERMV